MLLAHGGQAPVPDEPKLLPEDDRVHPTAPAMDQRSAVTGAGSMSSKDWFSPAMAHTNE